MGRPVFFVENLFNRRVFPSHAVSSSNADDNADWGAHFVGSGRRQASLNRWQSDTSNADAYVEITFDRVRAFDTFFIDRGHNLGGYPVELRVSSDGFTTYTTVASATIPTNVHPYSRMEDRRPILTEEGAVAWRVGTHAGRAARLVIPAMGAGLAPQIVGLYLGTEFRLTYPLALPFSHGKVELLYEQEQSPQAIVAAGEIGKRRRGEAHMRLANRPEYALARYHIEGLFLSRKPAWYVADDEEAEKARLTYAPPGTAGFEIMSGNWSEFQGQIPWIEHEPKIVGGS